MAEYSYTVLLEPAEEACPFRRLRVPSPTLDSDRPLVSLDYLQSRGLL
jgi:hypothetical protein